jgi:hypothetical protein
MPKPATASTVNRLHSDGFGGPVSSKHIAPHNPQQADDGDAAVYVPRYIKPKRERRTRENIVAIRNATRAAGATVMTAEGVDAAVSALESMGLLPEGRR